MSPEEAGLQLVRDVADLVIENAQLRRRVDGLEAVNVELVRRVEVSEMRPTIISDTKNK